jgi:hypothetical protein
MRKWKDSSRTGDQPRTFVACDGESGNAILVEAPNDVEALRMGRNVFRGSGRVFVFHLVKSQPPSAEKK